MFLASVRAGTASRLPLISSSSLEPRVQGCLLNVSTINECMKFNTCINNAIDSIVRIIHARPVQPDLKLFEKAIVYVISSLKFGSFSSITKLL